MSKRRNAMRKVLAAAINEGVARGLLTLKIGEIPSDEPFSFEVLGMTAWANFRSLFDGGLEIGVNVLIEPTGETDEHGRKWSKGWKGTAGNVKLYLGCNAPQRRLHRFAKVVACGWLEREHGAWIKNNISTFYCRPGLLSRLCELDVVPIGYLDRVPKCPKGYIVKGWN